MIKCDSTKSREFKLMDEKFDITKRKTVDAHNYYMYVKKGKNNMGKELY